MSSSPRSGSPTRAALITGASSGIGLAIARALGEGGYALTATARNPQKLAAAAKELREAAPRVLDVTADVAHEEELARVFERHREAYGRLDVLVNNAGTIVGAPLDSVPAEAIDAQLAVNLRAVIVGTREGVPLLRAAGAEHGKALIVNTSSLAGKVAHVPRHAIYAATKSAVINFTRSTNREVGGAGIQCTALVPGVVDTPMAMPLKFPREERVRPEDLAEAVRFLLRTSPNCRVPELILTHRAVGRARPSPAR